MTYEACEQYIEANLGQLKDRVYFGTAIFQYFGLLIAPDTFQIERIENIYNRCAPTGKVADSGPGNKEALIEAGEIDNELTVFIMGTMNGNFVYKQFSEYLQAVSQNIIISK